MAVAWRGGGTSAKLIGVRVDGVIFDLDGTLWDTTLVCVRAWNDVLARLDLGFAPVTQADIRAVTGSDHRSAVRTVFADVRHFWQQYPLAISFDGGTLSYELWPRVTVFIDSRSEVYGEELVAEFRRIKNLEESARRGLDRYSVDLVLVREFPYPSESSRNQGLLSVIEVDPRWGLLFVDDQSILYARLDLARELPIPFERFAPRRFHPNDPAVGHPKYQEEVRRAISRAPHSAFLRFVLASSLRAQGRSSEALAELRAGWKANPRFPAVSQLAGEIVAARGDVEQARRWFQRALSVAPHWGRARESLDALAPK